uniref:Uncharacterized protein n=1 Tax=Anguilla anguilla TaxID=7936 RepID=A0A0E9R8J9_ANGAN
MCGSEMFRVMEDFNIGTNFEQSFNLLLVHNILPVNKWIFFRFD